MPEFWDGGTLMRQVHMKSRGSTSRAQAGKCRVGSEFYDDSDANLDRSASRARPASNALIQYFLFRHRCSLRIWYDSGTEPPPRPSEIPSPILLLTLNACPPRHDTTVPSRAPPGSMINMFSFTEFKSTALPVCSKLDGNLRLSNTVVSVTPPHNVT